MCVSSYFECTCVVCMSVLGYDGSSCTPFRWFWSRWSIYSSQDSIPHLFFPQLVTPAILTTSLWTVLSGVEDGHLVCRSAFNFWFRGNLRSVDDEGLTSVYSRGHIHPKQCWWVPHRPRPRSVWPDFSPPSFWQPSPGIHRNAFSKTHDKDFGAPCLLPLMSSKVRSCPTPLSLCLTSWLNKKICIYAYWNGGSDFLLMQTCQCSEANRRKSLEN